MNNEDKINKKKPRGQHFKNSWSFPGVCAVFEQTLCVFKVTQKKKHAVNLAPRHHVFHNWKEETVFFKHSHSAKINEAIGGSEPPAAVELSLCMMPKSAPKQGMVCQQGASLITQSLTWDVKLSTASAPHLSRRRLGATKGEWDSNLCLLVLAPPHLSPPAQSP